MGVLTLPEARGRGRARQLVHAMAVSARASGLQPQYRCQLDNTASIITAERSGLRVRRLGHHSGGRLRPPQHNKEAT
jgi:predicted GNAT family acetyltransferase